MRVRICQRATVVQFIGRFQSRKTSYIYDVSERILIIHAHALKVEFDRACAHSESVSSIEASVRPDRHSFLVHNLAETAVNKKLLDIQIQCTKGSSFSSRRKRRPDFS